MKDWHPEGMIAELDKSKQTITKARVQSGGEGGCVAVFITNTNARFAYQMPSVVAAKTAVMMLAATDPSRFPVKLSSETPTRAVFKRP